ncbi:hypothetical protein H8E88_01420 [candidate division KSB1 bacterium]|nr:hypothetical protein [candidate division KSB1 bacterium]MBL7147171.1 hypothetical protein [Phycisphaerae bacterium]
MSKRPLAKKKSKESQLVESPGMSGAVIRNVLRSIAKQNLFSPITVLAILHEYGHILAKEKSEKLSEEELARVFFYSISSYSTQPSLRYGIERRLEQLEKATSSHDSALEIIKDRIGLIEEEEQKWPAYASEDFGKILENTKGLENADEDEALILYHIMEIETLLGKIERKARATNREYEARLAASLRDICRIHEPSELSNEQIKCFIGSLKALTEGWGELNREKVKWIRGRLLEVGLTWLPVTEKAQKVIDEAKSSVK